jgi:hypothetical protein
MSNIENKISSIKEVLSNLPKNNVKNQKRYLDELLSLKDEYSKYNDNIYKELNDRYNKIISISKDSNIDILENKLNEYSSYLYLLSNMTSYEMSGLDRVLFDLSHFYKVNLDRVNKDISLAIDIFRRVGINLNKSDFGYSSYSKKYMEIFLSNEFNSEVVKGTFENIYWECSDIIVHIELNFKYLYWKNKKIFDKFYEREKNNFLKSKSLDEKSYFSQYKDLCSSYDKVVFEDVATIYNNFISKKYNISDYKDGKIEKSCIELCNIDIDGDFKDEDIINISKLYNSLIEYKNYMSFIVFVDDIKKIYENRDKYKNITRDKFKNIKKLEGSLFSSNRKLNNYIRFGKKGKSLDGLRFKINNIILELKKLYDELDMDRFCEEVSKLDEHVNSFEVLSLVSSRYLYIRSVLKRDNDDLIDNDVDQVISSLKKFLISPYNIIINNLLINDNKNIPMIICDRYKLLNFNVNVDFFDISNIDSSIDIVYKILIYYEIIKRDISLDDIRFVCDMNSYISK